jgi:hypothetical protein
LLLLSLVRSLAAADTTLSALTVNGRYQTSVAPAERLLREARQDATGSATNSEVVATCLKCSSLVMNSFDLAVVHTSAT